MCDLVLHIWGSGRHDCSVLSANYALHISTLSINPRRCRLLHLEFLGLELQQMAIIQGGELGFKGILRNFSPPKYNDLQTFISMHYYIFMLLKYHKMNKEIRFLL